MKGTQLISSSTEEDPHSISIDPVGMDITPTMQVSLSKRIIQPGTNRVVCLAAQTTVPMEDHDIASVSDLALRLSDGTNVRVSMSFFNDISCGASFVGASTRQVDDSDSRRVYDPDWYDNHRASESSNRLWLVFAALCAVAFGSFCYFIPGGIEKLAAEIVAKMPPLPLPAPAKTPPLKAVSPVAANSTPTNVSQPNRKAKRTYTNNASAQPIKSPGKSGRMQNMTAKVSRSSSSGARSMLVPPPPPTAYAIPINQMPMFNVPPYTMPNSVLPSEPVSSIPKPKQPNLNIPKPTETGADVLSTSKTQASSKPALSQQTQALFPEPAKAYSHPRGSSTSYIEPLNKPATTGGANSVSAPVPGDHPQYIEQPQLERIELP